MPVAEEEQRARRKDRESRRSSRARSGGNPYCRRRGRWWRWRGPARAAARRRSSRASARTGTAKLSSAGGGSIRRAVSPRRSRHSTRSRFGRVATAPGSTTFAATGPKVQPSSRLAVMRSMRTCKASPGSAPSTKNGPVIGFGGAQRRAPALSKPQASTVSVTTVSPSAMRAAGSMPTQRIVEISADRNDGAPWAASGRRT